MVCGGGIGGVCDGCCGGGVMKNRIFALAIMFPFIASASTPTIRNGDCGSNPQGELLPMPIYNLPNQLPSPPGITNLGMLVVVGGNAVGGCRITFGVNAKTHSLQIPNVVIAPGNSKALGGGWVSFATTTGFTISGQLQEGAEFIVQTNYGEQ